ncbi:distal tail protein Dit [Mesobacillus sp. S13]|uniref:distal tail protein Dit n=1 Tax=Mesobacillus sp. S13 TaxID=2880221 RepID=UPI001CF1619F|nr:distal tail protein Dit [Mesobacillus sp. S13]
MSFTFRGIQKPYVTMTRGKKIPAFAPLTRNLFDVEGMPGAYPSSTKTNVRMLEIPIAIIADSMMDLQQMKEDMAEWLVTENPEELIFDAEPNRSYYAYIDGSMDLDEIVEVGEGVLTFLCPDPYKFGVEKSLDFINAASFHIEGTAETYPTITAEIKADTTFVAVSDGAERLNMIGMPLNVDEVAYEPETRILTDNMASTVGWTDTTSIEEGTKAGTLRSNGYSFVPDSYGTGTKWHGPALKRSLSEPLQDFRLEGILGQIGSAGEVGSVEIAGLDASNNFVFKLLMTKRSANSKAVWARIRAGSAVNGHDIMNEFGAYDWVWQYFYGVLGIQRIGNKWEAYVSKIDENGKRHSSSRKLWTDSTSIATAPVTQIQVQLWQHSTIPVTEQYVTDLKAWRVNPETAGVPIIAKAGDIVIFDHQNNLITKNGVDITKEKAFIGEYFPLEKGMNDIVIEPVEAIEKSEVRWKPRWL